jgi:ABC-2 type transport system ATP-binding protein
MIETVGLTRRFDGNIAVDDLNLKVDEGEVFGLLGPNGAGKTTTVRMLACLIGQTSGTAYVNGYEIGKRPDSEKIRGIVGVLPESPGLYESLSAHKNLDFYAQLYGVPSDRRRKSIEDMLKMLDLWDRREEPVATFSKGMKQKIAIARCFVHDPSIVFLDEPTAGLDPQAAMTVREFVLALAGEGRRVFIDNLDEVERMCDRIAVMNRTVLAVGNPKELARSYWGRTTVVELAELRQEFVDLVKGFEFAANVRSDGSSILVDIDDPKLRNPMMVEALVGAGARVEQVSELRRSLEEVYMKLIGGSGT